MRSFNQLFLAVAMTCACSDADVDEGSFAVDSDASGAVDCADLDHVLACIHHPDAHECATSDVNHDGTVDDTDVHDIHAGLTASGHHCPAPDHAHDSPSHPGDGHDTDGHHDHTGH